MTESWQHDMRPRSVSPQMEASLSELRQSGEQLRSAGLQLHRQLTALSGDKLKLPAVLHQPRVRKTSAGRVSPLKLSPTKLTSHGGCCGEYEWVDDLLNRLMDSERMVFA